MVVKNDNMHFALIVNPTVAAVTRNTFPATLFPLKFWSTSASDYTYLMKTGLCSNFVLQCGCSKPWCVSNPEVVLKSSSGINF
uniref:Uncharacterized protein n=1 Tax=Helianthus annuus TaxID=4232 RepID=A0A251S864_HELAN